jgi:hypothetical protein
MLEVKGCVTVVHVKPFVVKEYNKSPIISVAKQIDVPNDNNNDVITAILCL